MADSRAHARELARESIARGDVTGWFERLYAKSERDGFAISWVDLAPNPHLVEWIGERPARPRGRALVVGCGYGDDAELLAGLGLSVVAFDISSTAVRRCRSRFPGSIVEYVVADVLAPPAEWAGTFDFAFEAYTVQVLPGEARSACARSIGAMLAPDGILLVVARSRRPEDPAGAMPWPLTRAELDEFEVPGVRLAKLTEPVEPGDPPVPQIRGGVPAVVVGPGGGQHGPARSESGRQAVQRGEGGRPGARQFTFVKPSVSQSLRTVSQDAPSTETPLSLHPDSTPASTPFQRPARDSL